MSEWTSGGQPVSERARYELGEHMADQRKAMRYEMERGPHAVRGRQRSRPAASASVHTTKPQTLCDKEPMRPPSPKTPPPALSPVVAPFPNGPPTGKEVPNAWFTRVDLTRKEGSVGGGRGT